ncbi:ABC transporter substrate-binding protein [Paenibacillus sp. GCM10027627]|uniref:ABC transporter substrate-binding protein n=1 Tax=unclassified Paenibacillus TaxID=185978 RepID=UPI0036273EFF
MKNWFKKSVSVALMATLLAGCSFGGGSGEGKKTPTSLKVMYYDESSFFQEYGMLYSALHPEVDIQVVSTSQLRRDGENDEKFDYAKALEELVAKEKPDVILSDSNEFEKMAQNGKFLDLNANMTKDKFNTEGMIPGMVDYMKEIGGGQVYGLPSSFYTQVLFYNKTLFDKYNVPHPTDQMNWSDVIQLAKQFPTEGEPADRVYGLKVGYNGGLSEISSGIANSEGLNYVNPTTKQMTINTPGWKTATQTALDALNSKALYSEGDNPNMGGGGSYEDYLLQNPFISGKLAMTIDGTYFMDEIKRATEYIKEEGKVVKDWDIVTVPVSPQFPDESVDMRYNGIFSINKESTNPEAAWNFVSYVSSEEFARVKSKSNYGNFGVHTKYIKDEEGRNYAAFYKLKPSKNAIDYTEMEKLPSQFNMIFYDYMREEFKAIQDGKKSIDEALEVLQVKGEELIKQKSMTEEEMNEYWQKKDAEAQGGV